MKYKVEIIGPLLFNTQVYLFVSALSTTDSVFKPSLWIKCSVLRQIQMNAYYAVRMC